MSQLVAQRPLSMPLVACQYLVDSINDRDASVVWQADKTFKVTDEDGTEIPGMKDEWDHRNTCFWAISGAGVELNTDAITSVEVDDGGTSFVDPGVENFRRNLQILVAQASGFSYPKWGLDYVRMRAYSLINMERVAPAVIAEDMMERIKLSLNSSRCLSIYRIDNIPYTADPNTPRNVRNVRDEVPDFVNDTTIGHLLPKAIKGAKCRFPYVMPYLYRLEDGQSGDRGYSVEVSDDSGLEDGDPPPARDPIDDNVAYKHVANWSSTVLDGNTILQKVSSKGGSKFIAFSVDFQVYIEYIAPEVLGYRESIV